MFADAAVVLVTVKSADTSGMAEVIARHAPTMPLLSACRTASATLPCCAKNCRGAGVLGGMVPFNVIALGEAGFIAPPPATS